MLPAPGLLALLGLGCAAGAQKLTDAPTPENFYRRGTVSATLIGDYVYIDGGELSQVKEGNPPSKQTYASNSVNSTLSIDMSKSWTSSDVALRIIERPWPSKANQAIWTDRKAGTFYVWGGKWIRGVNMTTNELWKFTPDGHGAGTWATEAPANPELFNNLHQAENGAFVNSNDTGFFIGGLATGWTEKYRASTQTLPGMVAFNMDTKTWQNGTTSFSPFDTLAGGLAVYVPNLGSNGLIMVLGGVAHPVVGEPNWATAPAFDFQNLTFFDPQTKRRYWQLATGNIPLSPRVFACATGFQNPDGGYEIFLTGGENKRDQIRYDDAYVLSLPGFVWTKVPSQPSGKRSIASCISVGKRQVLSIGGTASGWTDQDPAPQGLLLFDMTDLKWKDSYDANAAAYQRATDLKTWYSNGSFDAVEWSSDEVRRLFLGKSTDAPSPSSTANSSATTSGTTSGTETPPISQSSTSVGAIAGGVVGGVAAIAIIAVIAWLLLKRRKGADAAPVPGADPDDPAPGYYAAHAAQPGYELTGSKVVPLELNSIRDHAELGGNATYYHHYPSPVPNQMVPVEMDGTGTPTRN